MYKTEPTDIRITKPLRFGNPLPYCKDTFLILTISFFNFKQYKNKYIMATILNNELNKIEQSPYLYLQAAGSGDGSPASPQITGVPGIYLRWAFMKSLGENHLARGKAYSGSSPDNSFIKAADFIELYSVNLNSTIMEEAKLEINLFSMKGPFPKIETGDTREWHFKHFNTVIIGDNGLVNVKRIIVLRFPEISKYDSVKSNNNFDTNLAMDRLAFIDAYDEVLELEIREEQGIKPELMFDAQIIVLSSEEGDNVVKLEAVSVRDEELFVSCRKQCTIRKPPTNSQVMVATNNNIALINQVSQVEVRLIDTKNDLITLQQSGSSGPAYEQEVRSLTDDINNYEQDIIDLDTQMSRTLSSNALSCSVHCENIQYIRFKCEYSNPFRFIVHTYVHFINVANQADLWLDIDKELSLPNVYGANIFDTRFLPSSINDVWPKYNDTAKVNADNYRARYGDPTDPDFLNNKETLIYGIEQYKNLSINDPKAIANLASEMNNDESEITVSYLEMLNLLALDFHIARILGLGYIDGRQSNAVYLIKYKPAITLLDNYGNDPNGGEHIYMSLPTKRIDTRLPLVPALEDLSYGLEMPDGKSLTNENGYVKEEALRFIRLNKAPYDIKYELGSFWGDGTLFCLCDHTIPVLYGIEHKKWSSGQSEPGEWENPELSHDPDFLDTNDPGIPEVVPIPEKDNPVYVHLDKEEGFNKYAIYGIDWFARPTPLSNTLTSDETLFPNTCKMLPPHNVMAHYIQREVPRLLSTEDEQDNHIGKIRLSFYWTHIQNMVNHKADTINVFIREGANTLSGQIKNIQEVPNEPNQIKLFTQAIPVTSSGQQNQAPLADSSMVGTYINIGGTSYLIVAVESGGTNEGSVFTIEKATDINTIGEIDGELVTSSNTLEPSVGDTFFIVPDLSGESDWKPLNKKIELNKFLDPTNEPISEDFYEEASQELKIRTVGGINITANITDLGEGMYKMSGINLPGLADSDTNTSWHKGIVRAPISSTHPTVRKMLEIWNYDSNNAEIIAYDPEYASIPNEEKILTGSQIVNIHPGYKTYIDLSLEDLDIQAMLELATGESVKQLYIVLQAEDTNEGGCKSFLSSKAVLFVLRDSEPVIPEIAIRENLFATRPDFYGRSTFAFDLLLDTTTGPSHSYVLYRAEASAILSNIYSDENNLNNAQSLLNGNPTLWDNLFLYDGISPLDGLPIPQQDTNILNEISNAFVPLTPQPLLYKKIMAQDYKMANFIQGANPSIRFTDYTLDGASQNQYFYCAVDLTERMEISDRSNVIGPVRLINTYPAEALEIKKAEVQLANTYLGQNPSIRIFYNPPLPEENITKIQVYRAYNQEDALSIRTMEDVGIIDDLSGIVTDEFNDLAFPPYGEDLFYRLVGIREIINEDSQTENVPSKPSSVVTVKIIDNINPVPPVIQATYNVAASGDYENVVLSWLKVTHNASYYLYKMNDFGNWNKIFEITPPEANDYTLTYDQIGTLLKQNENSQEVYHRFKVVVLNSSGLISEYEEVLVL